LLVSMSMRFLLMLVLGVIAVVNIGDTITLFLV
jgi:hypothetical protein